MRTAGARQPGCTASGAVLLLLLAAAAAQVSGGCVWRSGGSCACAAHGCARLTIVRSRCAPLRRFRNRCVLAAQVYHDPSEPIVDPETGKLLTSRPTAFGKYLNTKVGLRVGRLCLPVCARAQQLPCWDAPARACADALCVP